MWLRNVWQVAGFSSEMGENFVTRRLLNQHLLFYRTSKGRVVAMEDRCPHRLLPLSVGKRMGDAVQCGYHGMQFAADGKCVFAPGQAAPGAVQVRTFPVEERYNLIWIWLGEADLADASLIPNIYWFDNPDWTVVEGYHHFDAGYRLITDNLLDLSHETYVHQHTIGAEEIIETNVAISIDEKRAIRADRKMLNIDPPPMFSMFMNYSGKINRGQLAFYMPPGIHMTEFTGARVEGDPTVFLNRVMHLITPETERSSHYFWGQARNYRLDDQELSKLIGDATSRTFDEDKAILKLQQDRIIEEDANVPLAAIRFDAAPVQAQRMLNALIEQEQANPRFVAAPVPIAA